jgi:phage baseplate assembly protein gpV
MSGMVSAIQSIIRHELGRMRIAELGLVDAVYPHSGSGDDDNYGCDVRLKNSDLLLKRVPIATSHIGTAAIPNVGDLVVLLFDQGDVNQPIVMGRLYDEADRPPLNNPNEIISRLPLADDDSKTVKAAVRNIQANSPPREILIEMPPKIAVRITDGTVHITTGKTEMKLDQPDGSGGTVTILAGQTTITLNQDSDLAVNAAGAMTLTATGDLTLQGKNVTIKSDPASGQIDIEAGTQVSVKSSMGATVDGGLSATVKGATVAIDGITSFSPA